MKKFVTKAIHFLKAVRDLNQLDFLRTSSNLCDSVSINQRTVNYCHHKASVEISVNATVVWIIEDDFLALVFESSRDLINASEMQHQRFYPAFGIHSFIDTCIEAWPRLA